MKKTLFWVAWGSCVVACGSSATSKTSATLQDDPTALTDPVAQGIAIAKVKAFQVLEVPLADSGNPAARGRAPIVTGRDLVVRVYVAPDDTFAAGTVVTARMKIVNPSPTGETMTELLTLDMPVGGASTDGDLSTTFNFQVPGALVTTETKFAVVLQDLHGKAGSDNANAKYPTDGSLDSLGAKSAGPQVKVTIVPVRYMADGSGRLPDTSDKSLQGAHDEMYRLYPAPDVKITVRDPWKWSRTIGPDGTGWQEILQALVGLRSQDRAPADVYYYAMFAPAASFGQFCGGGCVAGLSFVGQPVSSGIGYGGDESAITMAHEVGHAHGLLHAPCGGAGNPDQQFPYSGGGIGLWGYDQIAGKPIDPARYKDVMGYCAPNWISDYHYARIFARVRTDNRVAADVVRRLYRMVSVDKLGRTAWGKTAWIDTRPADADRAVTYVGADGSVVAKDVGFFAPYDHLPGGVVFVPEMEGAAVARARIEGYADVVARY